MPATVNWEEIRRAYVMGELSIPEVAQQFGVTTSQAYQHCAAEKWVEERDEYRRETARKAKEKASEEASEVSALIFRIGKLILQRFLVALKEGGLNLTASDAERWAKILLALEQAGKAGEARRIVVQWVTNDRPGDNHTIYPASETGSVPPEQGPLPIFRGGDRIREDEGGGAGIPPPGV